MNPKLTDDTVAGLPLSAARAELLEEIMATPTIDRLDPDAPLVRRPRRWTTMAVAAAAVIGVAGVPAYVLSRDEPRTATPAAPASPTDPQGKYAVLDAPGWQVEYVLDDADGEVTFAQGGMSLDIHWRPAKYYDSYLEDRQHIDHPQVSDGAPIELLGQPARMWHYSKSDHTAIAEVVGEHFLEVRGSGMDEAAYLALLGQLRRADEAGFAAAMPDEVMTPQDRADTVEAMLVDIAVPQGWSASEVDLPRFADRYQVGAPLTQAVTCAWMKVYTVGQDSDDEQAVKAATEAMAGSRSWDILVEMQQSGAWAPMIWDVADAMAAGKPGSEIKDWMDCDGDGMSGQNP